MADRRVKILPVIEEGSLRGVITRMDILTLHVLNPGGSDLSGTVSGVRTPGRTWAEIDLGAVRHNVRALEHRAPGARLMAVVKADAYGHGAVPVSRAALEAGADGRRPTAEGAELRRAEIRVLLVFTDPGRTGSGSPRSTGSSSRPTRLRALAVWPPVLASRRI